MRCDARAVVSFHHDSVRERLVALDIGDPQLIATLAIELALYAIFGGCDVRHAPLTRSTRESLQACTAHQKLDGLTTYGDPES
jgi:hypothetical protein